MREWKTMSDFKLGPIDGAAALIVLVVAILAAVCLVAVLIVSIIKAVKERNDQKEDQAENEFFAEYGVTGEELRLNQKIAQKRKELFELMRKKVRKVKDEPVVEEVKDKPVEENASAVEPEQEPVREETIAQEEVAPVVEEVKQEEPVPVEPVQEPQKEETKEEVKEEVKEEEPVLEPVKEEIKEEPAPVEEPVPVVEQVQAPIKEESVQEEPKKQGVEKPAAKKVVKKKPDDWSKYDGTYEGYYYDPEDACYYEGTPSPELAKKLAAKEAELEALNANKDKKVVIKKVAAPFAALKTPKNKRNAPKPVAGFDESVIYGKYVIEHVDKEDGTQEWFYTLYDASGNNIYESSNYTTQAYCERAINRFKSHAIIGTYTIEAADGKFFFVLKRKTYVHKGSPQNTFEEANNHMREIKNFAQTDIVRVQ